MFVFDALLHVNVGHPNEDAPLGGWTSVGDVIVIAGGGGGVGGGVGMVGVTVLLPHATVATMSKDARMLCKSALFMAYAESPRNAVRRACCLYRNIMQSAAHGIKKS